MTEEPMKKKDYGALLKSGAACHVCGDRPGVVATNCVDIHGNTVHIDPPSRNTICKRLIKTLHV